MYTNIKFGNDNIQIFSLKTMQGTNFSKGIKSVYEITDFNNNQYPAYPKWYYTKMIPRLFSEDGEIYFALNGFEIIGVIMLKKSKKEKKICCLYVEEHFRRRGFGKIFIELAITFLNEEKPLITIPEKNIYMFQNIIDAYNWKKTSIITSYNTNEIVFN